jgi:hypothetical protein
VRSGVDGKMSLVGARRRRVDLAAARVLALSSVRRSNAPTPRRSILGAQFCRPRVITVGRTHTDDLGDLGWLSSARGQYRSCISNSAGTLPSALVWCQQCLISDPSARPNPDPNGLFTTGVCVCVWTSSLASWSTSGVWSSDCCGGLGRDPPRLHRGRGHRVSRPSFDASAWTVTRIAKRCAPTCRPITNG